MKYLIITFLLLQVMQHNSEATQITLRNYTTQSVRFQNFETNETLRVEIMPGQVALFEWPNSETVYIGTVFGMTEHTLTADGNTEIVVAWNPDLSQHVVALEGRKGWLMWFTYGFGFGFAVLGWGFILGIYKKAATHSVE